MVAAHVSVLGSTALVIDGEAVKLAARPRAVLTVLAVAAPSIVPPERIGAALWRGPPPRSATNAVQVYVSAVRRGAHEGGWRGDFVLRRDSGYLLDPAVTVDLQQLRTATERAEAALATGEASSAVGWLVGLTDPDPDTVLADLRQDSDPAMRHTVQALLERARMLFLRSLVDSGQPDRALPALLGLCEEYPERGDVVEQTALAYYRSGRPTAALHLVRQHRQHLRRDFGLDPGPWLEVLERRILTNHPALAPMTEVPPEALPQTCPHTESGSKVDSVRCARAAGAAVVRGSQDDVDIGPCLHRGRAELGDWGILNEVVTGALEALARPGVPPSGQPEQRPEPAPELSAGG